MLESSAAAYGSDVALSRSQQPHLLPSHSYLLNTHDSVTGSAADTAALKGSLRIDIRIRKTGKLDEVLQTSRNDCNLRIQADSTKVF